MRTKGENKIKVHIIRHGKTLLNERHCYIGVTDDPLSETGTKEIEDKVKAGIYKDVDKVFSSPMKRAMQTAKIIFKEKAVIAISEFRETDFGSFEGKNYSELKNNLYYRKWIDEAYGSLDKENKGLYENLPNPISNNIILPENNRDVIARVKSGFLKVLEQSEGVEEVAIVAHGGTISALCSSFLDGDFYKYMTACGDGISIDVTYGINDNGTVEISCFSIASRICS